MLSAASPRSCARSGQTTALTVRKKYDTKCASAKGRSTLASIRFRLLRSPIAACTGSTDGVLLKAYSLSCCACQAAGLRYGRSSRPILPAQDGRNSAQSRPRSSISQSSSGAGRISEKRIGSFFLASEGLGRVRHHQLDSLQAARGQHEVG